MSTPRTRFVEAIRSIVSAGKIDLGHAPYLGGYGPLLRAACEAFADATWQPNVHGTGEDLERLVLLRDCGLEEQ